MSFQKYVLKIKIVDESVRPYYEAAIKKLNTEEYLFDYHKDSGFDLYIPDSKQYLFQNNDTKLIDLGIQCAAYHYLIPTMKVPNPQAFCVYPRSSIYKTCFRLANNVGIIDSGYRGNLKAAFDCRFSSSEISQMTLAPFSTNNLTMPKPVSLSYNLVSISYNPFRAYTKIGLP